MTAPPAIDSEAVLAAAGDPRAPLPHRVLDPAAR